MKNYKGPLTGILILLSLAFICIIATSSIAIEKMAAGNVAQDKQVEVIIQKSAHSTPGSMLQPVGGEFVADLPIINGFIAKIPEDQLSTLGQQKDVLSYTVNSPAHWTLESFNSTKQRIGKDNQFKAAGKFENIYQAMVGSNQVKEKGAGVTIAVLDSGIGLDPYSKSRLNIVKEIAINPEATTTDDLYGHGTHVANIINGTGPAEVTGIAPEANIINVKLGNDQGEVTEIDLLLGLQWVYDFKDDYNIKVVNLSVSSSLPQSYIKTPISAAVEQLWLNGITVVVAAGNDKENVSGMDYAPANDPYVITVGSVDGRGNANPEEAILSYWSKHGYTTQGIEKPEVTAPGANIVSLLSGSSALLAVEHPESIINRNYFEMSGTSMAAPVVTGAIALMLEANPSLTPNQIKAILTQTTVEYNNMPDEAGVISAKEAVAFAKDQNRLASLDLAGYNEWPLSQFIGDSGTTIDYTKASWRSLDWLKASWRDVDWSKASWRNMDWAKASWRNLELALWGE